MKWIAGILACVLCLCFFAGCKQANPETTGSTPPPTTELTTQPTAGPATVPTEPPMDAGTLMDKMDALDNPLPTGLELLLEVGTKVDMQEYGMTMESEIQVAGSYLLNADPFRLYVQIEFTEKYRGEEEPYRFVAYGMEEDGEKVLYLGFPKYEMWMKLYESDLKENLDEALSGEPEPNGKITFSEKLLQEKLVQYGATECYILTLVPDLKQLVLDMVSKLEMEDVRENMPEFLEMDWNLLRIPIALYVEKDSMLVKRVTVEPEGMEDLLQDYLALLPEEDRIEMEMEFPVFRLELNNITYETVEVPLISEEDRLEADDQNYRAEQKDGSCLYKGETSDYRVIPPEGWEVSTYSKTTFRMRYTGGEEGHPMRNVFVRGEIFEDDITLEEDVADMVAEYNQLYEGEATGNMAESIRGLPVMVYSAPSSRIYVVHVPGGDGYLRLVINSYGYEVPYEYIQQIVECIEAVEPA